jgi:hypothetical protein
MRQILFDELASRSAIGIARPLAGDHRGVCWRRRRNTALETPARRSTPSPAGRQIRRDRTYAIAREATLTAITSTDRHYSPASGPASTTPGDA